MTASPIPDLSRCAIHTQTNKPWSLRQCIDGYRRIGVHQIGVWRHTLEPMGPTEAGRMLRDAGMKVPSLVRGGFFVAPDAADRRKAIDEMHRCIDEARAIDAEMIVLVVGACRGVSLADGRKMVADGIAAALPHARDCNVKLAIEPLHPMYAGDKSCVNRMTEARQICEQLNDPLVGIAADVWHIWWDPDVEKEITLAGKAGLLFGFHVCDWRENTRHMLTDRGLMGQGCIDIPKLRGLVEAAGFKGAIEVEIFSDEFWGMDQEVYLDLIREAYLKYV